MTGGQAVELSILVVLAVSTWALIVAHVVRHWNDHQGGRR